MTNTLEVLVPFSVMKEGEQLKKTNSGFYKFFKEESHDEMKSSSSYEISEEYAKHLIKSGYLKEVSEQPYVNIFEEIEDLIALYTKELETIDKDMINEPACLKIEKQTVLENMIKLLGYLKSLKK